MLVGKHLAGTGVLRTFRNRVPMKLTTHRVCKCHKPRTNRYGSHMQVGTALLHVWTCSACACCVDPWTCPRATGAASPLCLRGSLSTVYNVYLTRPTSRKQSCQLAHRTPSKQQPRPAGSSQKPANGPGNMAMISYHLLRGMPGARSQHNMIPPGS